MNLISLKVLTVELVNFIALIKVTRKTYLPVRLYSLITIPAYMVKCTFFSNHLEFQFISIKQHDLYINSCMYQNLSSLENDETSTIIFLISIGFLIFHTCNLSCQNLSSVWKFMQNDFCLEMKFLCIS